MRFHGHKNRNSILKTGQGRIHLYYGKSRDRDVRIMSLSLDWTAYRDIVGRKGRREEQRRDGGKEGKIALLGCH